MCDHDRYSKVSLVSTWSAFYENTDAVFFDLRLNNVLAGTSIDDSYSSQVLGFYRTFFRNDKIEMSNQSVFDKTKQIQAMLSLKF